MKKRPNPRPTDEELQLFTAFWERYPAGNKGRRLRALRIFVEMLRENAAECAAVCASLTLYAEIMEGVDRYRRYCRYEFWSRGELAFRYQLHAKTFLEKRRFEEEWRAPFDPEVGVNTDDPNEVDWWLEHMGCRS